MTETIAFHVVELKENKGHGNARRVSMQNCKNSLIALMDADDISFPYRFEKQLEQFVKIPALSITGGQITEFIGNCDNITGIREVPLEHEDICRYMKRRCPMNQVTVMVKKEEVEKAGGYRDWFCNEDYYLWLRMMRAGCYFTNVPEVLVNARTGDGMTARRGGMKYFLSERRLQQYMLKAGIISFPRYVYNVLLRFGGEVAANHWIRGRLFKFVRRSVSEKEREKILQRSHEANVYMENISNDQKKYPPFSVAMSVYGKDNAEWFDMALNSVVGQTVKPDEIVLVVDGAVPQSVRSVINKYCEICSGG